MKSLISFLVIISAVTSFQFNSYRNGVSRKPQQILREVLFIRRTRLNNAENSVGSDSLTSLIEATKQIEAEALAAIKGATSSNEIEVFRVAYLGKNGKIMGMMKEMKKLEKSDKPKLGATVNEAVKSVEGMIEKTKLEIEDKEFKKMLQDEALGNTMQIPGVPIFHDAPGTRHPINLVMDLTSKIFADIGYEIITGPDQSPEIEHDFYNFEALGMPFNHPARDMQDTLYIDTSDLSSNDTLLLRTHTSSVQIREMEKRKPPFKICAPGRVYRKDDVDATHFPVFHQVEILAVDEIGKLTLPHLLGTVKYFLRKMFGPEIEVKYRASYFPFTEPSVEVDVFFKGKWLEVLGCGLVDPVVLEAVGIDPTKYSGFAAGFGVERFAMIMHNIQDIRLFWENHEDFLQQFPTNPYSPPGDDVGVEKVNEDEGFDDDFF